MDHTGFLGVVEALPLALVGKYRRGAVGRRRHGAPSVAAFYDLGGEVVDRHRCPALNFPPLAACGNLSGMVAQRATYSQEYV